MQNKKEKEKQNIKNHFPISEVRFSKTDIFLMLGLVIAMGVLCFTLGVKMGKKQALTAYKEFVVTHPKQESPKTLNKEVEEIAGLKDSLVTFSGTEEDIEKARESDSDSESESLGLVEVEKKSQETPIEVSERVVFLGENDQRYQGFFTIVVGEFLDIEEASFFSEAFSERGYDAYMQKRIGKDGAEKIRVSLGAYGSKAAVDKFIQERSEIFIKNKYMIDTF